MPAFLSSIDVANRALQHVGAARIRTFDDDSKGASAVQFCYDKLREAEMRRNIWTFSVRRAAMRPVDLTTTQLAPAAWAVGTNYGHGAVVVSANLMWESQVANNIGNTPGTPGDTTWELYSGPLSIRQFVVSSANPAKSDVAYWSGELVLGNGDLGNTTVYRSLMDGNDDIPPSAKWLSLGEVSAPLSFLYPIGSGPVEEVMSRNVFLLPANYLREAPQDPKMGNFSYLGAPHNLFVDDWVFQDGTIISAISTVILFRFVASVVRVNKMDPMFCEGLACRIGLEICEELTQSADKISTIGGVYKTFMGEARIVNAIEQGSLEPAEDDWVACRI